jgi:hypothetical protein
VTTQENSTTMSLYGYGLAYYVVEASLAYQLVVRIERGSWDPSGWEWMGKRVDSPENHMTEEGALGDLDWHLQWNLSGLDKAIEKPYSDVVGHTLEVCKGTPSDQWVPGCQEWSQLMGNVYNLCRV